MNVLCDLREVPPGSKGESKQKFHHHSRQGIARKILTQRPWGSTRAVSLQGFFFLHIPRHLDPVNINNSRETQSSGTLP